MNVSAVVRAGLLPTTGSKKVTIQMLPNRSWRDNEKQSREKNEERQEKRPMPHTLEFLRLENSFNVRGICNLCEVYDVSPVLDK